LPNATGTFAGMDITYVTTAELASRWHMKRDTVAARLRAVGVTEYRFGLRTIHWDLAEVAQAPRSAGVVQRSSASAVM
jgi:hypothetical protein